MGYVYLALAQIFLGLNLTLGKIMLHSLEPYVLVFIRYVGSSLFMFSLVLMTGSKLTHPKHPGGRLTLMDWLVMAAQALCAGFLFNAFFYAGLAHTTATSASIISSVLPAVTALMAFFILKERLLARQWFAVALGVMGILVIGLDNTPAGDTKAGSWVGDFLIFCAMIPESYYSILSKKLKNRVTPLASAAMVNLFTLAFTAPFAIPQISSLSILFTDLNLCLLIGASSLLSGSFFYLWVMGLETIPAGVAGLFGGLVPVFTSISAYIWLKEEFSAYDACGMALVLASIVICTKPPPSQKIAS